MSHAILDAVKRASERSATVVHGEMKRGLNSLASIAATAPFLGFFGTVLGISGLFRGFSADYSTIRLFIIRGMAEALVPTALGLLVALLAFYSHKYLLSRVERFDLEMQEASEQLISDLTRSSLWKRLR